MADWLLSEHWQKICAFRKRHRAIGAGKHWALAKSPYTFVREWTESEKGEPADQVIVVFGASGRTKVMVDDVFVDGTLIHEAYTDRYAFVQKGKIYFDAPTCGLLMLERSVLNEMRDETKMI